MQLDGFYGAVGTFALAISPVAPVNDNFTSRWVVAGPAVSVSGTNAGASLEAGERVDGLPTLQRSVWYT